ncbi:MAG TPA: methyltransferase [Acidobacteriota bacterium]|nr:methyltransferase [Acidobacteriota bacterium]
MKERFLLFTQKEIQQMLMFSKETTLSLDQGRTQSIVIPEKDAIVIDGKRVSRKDFTKRISADVFYTIESVDEENGRLARVSFFDEQTQLVYQLVPTKDWPTFRLSSTPMHQIVHMSPKEDTLAKLKPLGEITGVVLDTCCGLGYTAICASKKADRVITCERDPNVLFLTRISPWSAALYEHSKIEIKESIVEEVIAGMDDESVDVILHDPPAVALSSNLFTSDFYDDMFRVLVAGGKLYHYCPRPQKTKGREFYKEVSTRLKKIGFVIDSYQEDVSGLYAHKPK